MRSPFRKIDFFRIDEEYWIRLIEVNNFNHFTICAMFLFCVCVFCAADVCFYFTLSHYSTTCAQWNVFIHVISSIHVAANCLMCTITYLNFCYTMRVQKSVDSRVRVEGIGEKSSAATCSSHDTECQLNATYSTSLFHIVEEKKKFQRRIFDTTFPSSFNTSVKTIILCKVYNSHWTLELYRRLYFGVYKRCSLQMFSGLQREKNVKRYLFISFHAKAAIYFFVFIGHSSTASFL